MAAAQLNRTRRALLGAAVGLPLLGAAGSPGPLHPPSPLAAAGPPPCSGEDWRRALAAFETLEAELRAFERRTAGAPWEERERVEQGMDERLDAFLPALRQLLRIPSPDLEALLTKFALITDYQVAELTGGEACLAVFRRDARRLAAAQGGGGG